MSLFKKIKALSLAAALLLISAPTWAGPSKDDSSSSPKRWSLSPIPTISYNTDLGLQLGALCDIYHYDQNHQSPYYKEKIYLDFGWATKGSGYVHAYFDSPALTENLRMTAAATYRISSLYPFYGFNGLASPLMPEMDRNKESRTAYYNMGLNMLRIMLTFQGKIHGPLKWIAGTNFWDFRVKDIPGKDYDPNNTLLKKYIEKGIINKDEAAGGSHLELRAGVSYDSRDHEAAPGKGIWAEAYVYGSKDFFMGGYDYLKAAVHFRHYFPIWKKTIIGAYHLAYQSTLAGDAPFYMQQEIATVLLKQPETDGLGGRNTVRGMLLNRMVGRGYAWGNFELRCNLYSFNLLGKYWQIGCNPFFDIGGVVQNYRLERMKNSPEPSIYRGESERPHLSAGAGLKLSMDYNFILSAEFAKPFSKQDGLYGLNIGLNYIF